jgi:virginiamycin A acetyltransferase
MKKFIKRIVQGISLVCVFPLALLSAFGRVEPFYLLGAQFFALFPGLPGDYLRIAYCRLTLEECSLDSRMQFGSFFAHPQARVAQGVYIGSFCVLGHTSIGERTQIASGVQIVSGRHQHGRNAEGQILGAEVGPFQSISIGADCWIGAAAIVMADVGSGTTIGAGSVVAKPVPPRTVAAGNPARVIKTIGVD